MAKENLTVSVNGEFFKSYIAKTSVRMSLSDFFIKKLSKNITKQDLPFIAKMLKPKFEKAVPAIVADIRKTGYDFVRTDFKNKFSEHLSRCNCLPEKKEDFGSVEDLKQKNIFGLDLSQVDPDMIERFLLSIVYTLDEKTLVFTVYFELIFGMIKLEYNINPPNDASTEFLKPE